MLLALSEFPVARCRSAIALFSSVCARSSLLRGKLWQAEYMVSAVRDHVFAMACIRLGLPSAHGRGMDRLPKEITGPMLGSLMGKLDAEELWRAFGVVMEGLAGEVMVADPAFGERVADELRGLASKPSE